MSDGRDARQGPPMWRTSLSPMAVGASPLRADASWTRNGHVERTKEKVRSISDEGPA
jgi:hypothetical protein